MTLRPQSSDRQWYIVSRWEEYEGETRTNLLRLLGIGSFYLIEMANYYGLRLGWFELPQVVDRPFHQTVTAVALVWTLVAMAILVCLQWRVFPSFLKYLSTGVDLVLLTVILGLGDAMASPLVVAYFLVIALATVRFSLPLVRFAAFGSMAGYATLIGYVHWFAARPHVPVYHELTFLLALALSGLLLGQLVRRVHALAQQYAARTAAATETSPKPQPPAPGAEVTS